MNPIKVFDFAYCMAFRDATGRRAFILNETENVENFKNEKEEVKRELRAFVKNAIDELNEKTVETQMWDNYIMELCSLEKERVNSGFTYGNAQKLLNMTAKYMYLSCYFNPKRRFVFRNCHCPMDRKIMDEVIRQRRERGLEILPYVDGKGKEVKDWSKVSWSRLTVDWVKKAKGRDPYHIFQKMVDELRDNLYPIEYDYMYYEQDENRGQY